MQNRHKLVDERKKLLIAIHLSAVKILAHFGFYGWSMVYGV